MAGVPDPILSPDLEIAFTRFVSLITRKNEIAQAIPAARNPRVRVTPMMADCSKLHIK